MLRMIKQTTLMIIGIKDYEKTIVKSFVLILQLHSSIQRVILKSGEEHICICTVKSFECLLNFYDSLCLFQPAEGRYEPFKQNQVLQKNFKCQPK